MLRISAVLHSPFVIWASLFKIKRMNHDEAHRHLSVSDKRLAQLISRSHRYNIEPNLNVRPFDALAESIAYQQLSGKAAATIWKRVRAIFPKRKFLAPKLVLETPDDEIIERLIQVRGIGRWTAEMLLLFDLGRADVWPVHDYGVRKGFAKIFGKRKLPTPKQMDKHGRKFQPYRSALAWYCWRALDVERKS